MLSQVVRELRSADCLLLAAALYVRHACLSRHDMRQVCRALCRKALAADPLDPLLVGPAPATTNEREGRREEACVSGIKSSAKTVSCTTRQGCTTPRRKHCHSTPFKRHTFRIGSMFSRSNGARTVKTAQPLLAKSSVFPQVAATLRGADAKEANTLIRHALHQDDPSSVCRSAGWLLKTALHGASNGVSTFETVFQTPKYRVFAF